MKKLREEKGEAIIKVIKLLQNAGFHVSEKIDINCESNTQYILGDMDGIINQRFTGLIEFDIPEVYFEDA